MEVLKDEHSGSHGFEYLLVVLLSFGWDGQDVVHFERPVVRAFLILQLLPEVLVVVH